MGLLQVDEFLEEAVELAIGDDRRRLDVVEVVVAIDFAAKLGSPLGE
jgi:hypothetical protein